MAGRCRNITARGISYAAVLVLIGVVAVVGFFLLWSQGYFVRQVWTRDHPLASPTAVAGVRDGRITLVDGREFRPAGIKRRDDIPAADYDAALSACTAQGVVVTRQLEDGRALVMVEPKFYNWCGTNNGWTHPAGTYVQCGLSEAMVLLNYAVPEQSQSGMTPREMWRIEGMTHLNGNVDVGPRALAGLGLAFRMSGEELCLFSPDETIEAIWQPPPE